jgi:hypothetical protein
MAICALDNTRIGEALVLQILISIDCGIPKEGFFVNFFWGRACFFLFDRWDGTSSPPTFEYSVYYLFLSLTGVNH